MWKIRTCRSSVWPELRQNKLLSLWQHNHTEPGAAIHGLAMDHPCLSLPSVLPAQRMLSPHSGQETAPSLGVYMLFPQTHAGSWLSCLKGSFGLKRKAVNRIKWILKGVWRKEKGTGTHTSLCRVSASTKAGEQLLGLFWGALEWWCSCRKMCS